MIKQIYKVTYRDSFGYAETEEEALELEKEFKDIVTPVGYDVNAKIVLVVKGRDLNRRKYLRKFIGDKERDINMDVYSKTIGYEENSLYKIYVEKEINPYIDSYDNEYYMVKRIEECKKES